MPCKVCLCIIYWIHCGSVEFLHPLGCFFSLVAILTVSIVRLAVALLAWILITSTDMRSHLLSDSIVLCSQSRTHYIYQYITHPILYYSHSIEKTNKAIGCGDGNGGGVKN